MNPRWSLLPTLLKLQLSLILASFPFSSSVNYTEQCVMTLYGCGDECYNVSYPFNFPGRPNFCGRRGYDLTCVDEKFLMLNTSGKQYKVRNMDYSTYSLTISYPAKYDDAPCSSLPSFTDTEMDHSLFEYSPDIVGKISIINCTPTEPYPENRSINCAFDLGVRLYYSFEYDSVSRPNCEVTRVWISQTTLHGLRNSSIEFWDALEEGFTVTWKSGSRPPCDRCSQLGGVCIYSDTSGREQCVRGYVAGHKRNIKEIAIGISAVSGFLLMCAALLFYTQQQFMLNCFNILFKKSDNIHNIEAFLEENDHISPKRYKYSDLRRITKSFHEKLGQGGNGTVFKGTLQYGHLVAVKMLIRSKGNGEEFINEVASIGKTSHINIVRLLGFCVHGHKRALVYEFMSNGSLDKFIYSDEERMSLGWERMQDIAVGIARGLEYLHRGCNTRMVHFDIKPQNILLDNDFCPKISDFGLAKLCPPKNSIISTMDARGTIGYIAPEIFCRNFGAVSTKSDVYSYGMMVLEMAGTTKDPTASDGNSSEVYFPQCVYKKLEQDGDLQASGVSVENSETAKKLILVGLWCIQTIPSNRPSMRRVIKMLEGKVDDIELPPQPSYLSPSLSSLHSS